MQLELDSGVGVQSAGSSLLYAGHGFKNLASKNVLLDLPPQPNILLVLQHTQLRKEKEKTAPFGVRLTTSLVIYQAAQIRG